MAVRQQHLLSISKLTGSILGLLCLMLFSLTSSAGIFSDDLSFGKDAPQYLKAEEAFIPSITAVNKKRLLAKFVIQDGYYIYKDKIKFSTSNTNVSIQQVTFPKGKIKNDPLFGEVEVFDQDTEMSVLIDVADAKITDFDISLAFQGCAEDGICYAPQTNIHPISIASLSDPKTTSEPVSTSTVNNIEEPAQSESDAIASLLTDKPLLISLALFFSFGLALSLTPCVYPMIPILSGILVGQGVNLTPRKSFMLALVYVLGMATTYAIVGVIAGSFGHNLQAIFQTPWILASFAGVFVLLALSMFGFYDIQLPSALQTRLTNLSDNQERGTLHGAGLMGIFSAVIVGPCVAPPLAGALIFIGESGNGFLGGAALFVMGLGMGVPLLLLGASAGKLLPRAGVWMNVVKHVFGVLMLAVAIWLLERIIPAPASLALWGLLLIGSSVYMGAFDTLSDVSTGWQRLWKATGLAMALYGALLIIGAASNANNVFQPLKNIAGSQSVSHQEEGLSFQQVKGLSGLETALKSAAAENKAVMLDFYADWCKECIRMEKTTFIDSNVHQALNNVVILQADVTLNDKADQELQRSLDLLGPPAILFYDQTGKEKRNFRLTGYSGPNKFFNHLQQAFN